MKGFVHVVEIVIITIVVFVLIYQATSVPTISRDWGKTSLEIQVRDILLSLNKKGINWLNKSEVEEELDALLQNTSIRYGLKIENALKENISVGCFCNDTEYFYLKSVLYPFMLNGEYVSFTIYKLDTHNPSFPITFDVVFLADNAKNVSYDQLRSFLSEGKGIVEVVDLTEGDISGDSVQENIFGLKWNSALTPNSNNITFSIDSESEFYNIYKYFYNIPNLTGWIPPENHTLKNFLDPNEKVDAKNGNNIVLKQKATNVPAAIVNNKIFEGKGRAVWLSAGNDESVEKKMMLRSLILWASGETYEVVENKIPNPASFSIFKLIKKGEYNPGMDQIIKVTLSLGHVFD